LDIGQRGAEFFCSVLCGVYFFAFCFKFLIGPVITKGPHFRSYGP
jgi:hypothetical protein